jgi:hypothetical protein
VSYPLLDDSFNLENKDVKEPKNIYALSNMGATLNENGNYSGAILF